MLFLNYSKFSKSGRVSLHEFLLIYLHDFLLSASNFQCLPLLFMN